VNLGLRLSELGIILCLIGLVSLIPLPGVSAETEVIFEGESYDFYLVNDSSVSDDAEVWGVHDMVTNEISVATKGLGVYPFMETCSHEVQHLQYDIEGDRTGDHLTTVEEHKRMDGLRSDWFPWSWETQCIGLLPERLSF